VNVYQLLTIIWMILKAQMQTVEDKTVISGLHWYASDRYGLPITVGGVGCVGVSLQSNQVRPGVALVRLIGHW